jgi:hypothetical protein
LSDGDVLDVSGRFETLEQLDDLGVGILLALEILRLFDS